MEDGRRTSRRKAILYGLLTWLAVGLVFLAYLFCPFSFIAAVHAADVESMAGGTGTLDNTGPSTKKIHTYSQGECTPWPDTSILCVNDASCDAACVDVDDPSPCCTGLGASTCTCEERSLEGMYLVSPVKPSLERLACDGMAQQLFAGQYTPAYCCALWLDPDDGGPLCVGGSTLEDDCDNGVIVPWRYPKNPTPDTRNAASFFVVCPSGETLNVLCGGCE
jgi:hypothetical protein